MDKFYFDSAKLKYKMDEGSNNNPRFRLPMD